MTNDDDTTAREGWDGSNPDEWAPMPARRHTANTSVIPTPGTKASEILVLAAGAAIGITIFAGLYLELAFFAR